MDFESFGGKYLLLCFPLGDGIIIINDQIFIADYFTCVTLLLSSTPKLFIFLTAIFIAIILIFISHLPYIYQVLFYF